MTDELQDSWNRLMGKEPKRPSFLWLVLGGALGVAVQVGPGALAGALDWSPWWAVGWGFVYGFPWSTIVRIGRGMLVGFRPPHWLSALITVLPLSTALFAALNLLTYWLMHWLLR